MVAQHRNWTALQAIDHLFELELELRRKNKIERCFKQSRLYEKTTIDQFDFAFHGSRKNQKSKMRVSNFWEVYSPLWLSRQISTSDLTHLKKRSY